MAKIIHVTTFFYPAQGGVEQQVLELATKLKKQGQEVEVICSDSSHTKEKIQEVHGVVKGVPVTRCKTWFSISQFYKFYPSLFFELIKRDFDIVHVHGFRKYEVYAALLAAKLKRKKIVVTTHNPFFTTTRGKLLQLFVNLHDLTLGKLCTRFIDKIICITSLEIPYIQKFNVSQEKIVVIPNGIEKAKFIKGNAKKFIKKYNVPSKKFKHIVLWLGRVHKMKGLENLETAVKQLKDVLFVFAGAPDEGSDVIKAFYKSQPNVLFTGEFPNTEAVDACQMADIFVFPSIHEAFGVVLLEAMAQGLPVISTNNGGPQEIVKSSFGFLQKPQDQWGWMFTIKKLLQNKTLRRKMGEAAKKEAEKYTWENLIGKVLKVYNQELETENSKVKSD
jgi:glycosyltransferase involved in cell wall biosynthesis